MSSKVRIKKIEFLEATKRYKRMLKITLSNRATVYAGADYISWGVDDNGSDQANREATWATIEVYDKWLRGGEMP